MVFLKENNFEGEIAKLNDPTRGNPTSDGKIPMKYSGIREGLSDPRPDDALASRIGAWPRPHGSRGLHLEENPPIDLDFAQTACRFENHGDGDVSGENPRPHNRRGLQLDQYETRYEPTDEPTRLGDKGFFDEPFENEDDEPMLRIQLDPIGTVYDESQTRFSTTPKIRMP